MKQKSSVFRYVYEVKDAEKKVKDSSWNISVLLFEKNYVNLFKILQSYNDLKLLLIS